MFDEKAAVSSQLSAASRKKITVGSWWLVISGQWLEEIVCSL